MRWTIRQSSRSAAGEHRRGALCLRAVFSTRLARPRLSEQRSAVFEALLRGETALETIPADAQHSPRAGIRAADAWPSIGGAKP